MDKSDRLSTLIDGVRSSLLANPNVSGHAEGEAWLFRDDIGAPHGIKGYEEQVNSVGMHHGHSHWPSEGAW